MCPCVFLTFHFLWDNQQPVIFSSLFLFFLLVTFLVVRLGMTVERAWGRCRRFQRGLML